MIRQLIVLMTLAALIAVSGCAEVEVDKKIPSCHDYRAHSKFGRFTVHQKAKGTAIQWGTYPSGRYVGDSYEVTPRLGGRKVDPKKQYYPPHGSVGADRARKYSGSLFRIDGKVRRHGRLVLQFTMQCRVL